MDSLSSINTNKNIVGEYAWDYVARRCGLIQVDEDVVCIDWTWPRLRLSKKEVVVHRAFSKSASQIQHNGCYTITQSPFSDPRPCLYVVCCKTLLRESVFCRSGVKMHILKQRGEKIKSREQIQRCVMFHILALQSSEELRRSRMVFIQQSICMFVSFNYRTFLPWSSVLTFQFCTCIISLGTLHIQVQVKEKYFGRKK